VMSSPQRQLPSDLPIRANLWCSRDDVHFGSRGRIESVP
jgi:hypothetical protein